MRPCRLCTSCIPAARPGAAGTDRTPWCTGSQWESNRITIGRPRAISSGILHGRHREPGRMKTSVIAPSRPKKANTQASFAGSILKAKMEAEAAIELAHDLEASGMPCVCIVLEC